MLKFRKKIICSIFALGILSLPFFSDLLVFFSVFVCSIAAIAYFFTKDVQSAMDVLKRECFISLTRSEEEWSELIASFRLLQEKVQEQIANFTSQREEILESISEGIIATDTSAKVTFANLAACKMLGFPSDDFLHCSLERWGSDLSSKCHELILYALQTSETLTQSWNLQENRCLHLTATPLVHNSGALLVLQDKTSDYKMIEMGKAFIANASHELRTPITIIRGFAETLLEHVDLSRESLKKSANKIVQTCGRLDNLVRSLLTLADIENRSEEQFKFSDLEIILENSKHIFTAAYPDVTFEFGGVKRSSAIKCDANLLELAILNLLENAAKYSKKNPKIRLWVESSESNVKIYIKDFGIGISEKDLTQVFDRFYTVDKARSRKSGGAGLGLSIVKTIMEKHKGEVYASSELGKGSVFVLSFPRSS
jgi:two-component system phosphate regulon sensor histidine kinase PhoR